MPANYKGDFFTISFNPEKLQVVHIDSTALKQVRTLVTVNLPKSLIVNYKVANKTALADFIKKSLHEVKIDEKNVAVVIPEFSAYTKLVQLPNIPESEVAEAIRWQIKDFLPSASADMVVDSRIIASKNNVVEHLVVAVEKDLLYSYIDSVILAGLNPIAVETQALSLARIAGTTGKNTLTVYKNFGEVILIACAGNRIYGSSVVPVDDSNSVLNTIDRMLKHYEKQFKPEKIIVGGKGFNENFYNTVKQITKIAPEGVLSRVEGVSDSEFNDFLIPISTQTTEAKEPSDTTTVNLLPPVFSQDRNSRKIWKRVSLLLSVVLIVFISCLASLYVIYNLVLKNTGIALVNPDTPVSENAEQIVSEINSANNLAKKITAAKDLTIYPQEVLNSISKARPSGVIVNEYKLNLDQGVFLVTGVAGTRQDLVSFRNNLNNSGEFEELTLPITSLEQVNDISFEINLKSKKAAKNEIPKIKL